jgi:hypothetical protein
MAEADKALTEEERLVRAMERKANLAFEQKRKEALQKYQSKSGHKLDFALNEEPADAAIKRQVAKQHSISHDAPSKDTTDHLASEAARRAREDLGQRGAVHTQLENPSLNKYMEESDRAERDFRQRHADEDARKKAELANFGNSLASYQEQADARDRELKRRLEEEERRKQAEMQSYGQGLSKYEAAAEQRDRELKERLASEEKRRTEEMAATAAKLQSFKEKQEAEEREFRRKRDEEERKKQETLAAMEAADRARREAALARTRQEEEDRKRAAAAAAAVKYRYKKKKKTKDIEEKQCSLTPFLFLFSCSTCGLQLGKESAMNVKGKMYCYKCSVAAGADQCAGCSKPILTGGKEKRMKGIEVEKKRA